jgi:hypothetical protein
MSSEHKHKYIRELTKIRETETVPTHLMGDDVVGKIDFDYSTRGPNDYVISGPISGRGSGPGREFLSADDAEAWGREHFGNRFKYRIRDSEKGGRWAILIAPINTGING